MQYFGDKLYEDYPNAMLINWNMTSYCPYGCSYCFGKNKPELHKDSFEVLYNASIKLKELYKDIFYQISLTGGEPLSRSDIIKIINMYNDVFQNNRIVLLSNLFLPEKLLYKMFSSIEDKKKIILVGSMHLEKVQNIQKYLDKIRAIKTFDFNEIKYKIIVTSKDMEKAISVIKILEKDYIDLIPNTSVVRNFLEQFEMPTIFQKYMVNDSIMIYKKDDYKQPISYVEIKDKQLNRVKNFSCSIGKKHLYITPTGMVFGAYHDINCKQNPSFGSLSDTTTFDRIKEFLKQKDIICQEEICPSECLMLIPKYKKEDPFIYK